MTAAVKHFVIQNGSNFGMGGGGILNEGTLTFSGGIVSSNVGAGIRNDGNLILNNSTISDNIGGGISNRSDLILNSSTVRGNTSSGGGGISNTGTLSLNNSSVSENIAMGGSGGGILNSPGTVTLNNSTIKDNFTNISGGGIDNNSGIVTLNNSTVSGNTASSGGGIATSGGIQSGATLTLNSSTVSGNSATGGGGGGISVGSGSTTLRNSLLAGNMTSNVSPDCSSSFESEGYNLIGDTSGCAFTPGPGDLTDIDPLIGPLWDNGGPADTHALLPGSPAINAGDPAGCIDHLDNPLTTDQRSAPRVGRCDIGAYEAGLAVTWDVTGTLESGSVAAFEFALSSREGAVDLDNVSLTDTLPSSLTYVPGSFSTNYGSGEENGGVISWNGTVLADSSAVISFSAVIDDELPLCSIIRNTALLNHGGNFGFEQPIELMISCQLCGITKYSSNPVLSAGPSGSWDAANVWAPAVLKEGTTYQMWYTGDDGAGPSHIGLAESSDGINWTREASNPVISPTETWETNGIVVGSIVYDSSDYEMWYTGFDGSGVGRIGYATSPDGITWTKHAGNPVIDVGLPGSWQDEDVGRPSVIKQDGTYSMWYEGNDGLTSRIGNATSGNGVHWFKVPTEPALDAGAPGGWDWLHAYAPSGVIYDEVFFLWYSGGTLPPAWQTGFASSPNGAGWIRGRMLIAEGATGAFDANSADYASAIANGSGFKIWYSGLNGSGTHSIGYANAELCGTGSPPSNQIYLPAVARDWDPGAVCPAYYTDEFRNPGSGWPTLENSSVKFAYTDGEYQIWVKNPFSGWSVTPGAKASDFTVAVDARRTSGNSGAYGIRFGISEDWNEFYELIIDANEYSIWRYDGGWTVLSDWAFSDSINTGTSWNRLKVIRDDANITAYINNQQLATVSDSSLTGFRRVGLVAYSPGGALDTRFDNFELFPSSCGDLALLEGFEMGTPEIRESPLPPSLDRSP